MRTLLAVLLAAAAPPAAAADPSSPHAHQGLLAPYPTPPAAVTLTADQERRFAAGEPVYTQVDGGTQGRGVAVFLVNAPPARVWATIRDFPSYPGWIDGLDSCEVYRAEGDHIYAGFVISKLGMSVEYYIDHNAPQGADWMTWRLDYGRSSDIDDSVGMWRVTALPSDPSKSRVEYSVDVAVSGWVPGFVREYAVDRGLKEATSWVKVQSER